ncbi:hypothetical protein TGPRC2_278710 [Toxoplasma gondii TgCatPRC2]|uniref:Uncharacterized protein n=1 Tax=Toxoplasma gondii TgCatPRC2 TaxID=1130821 RepID=A0A151H7H0_TOXGO|nr:hypothetical protein TGPRC2_278710 [Toxoplasma gondii TgCatPRC2]
MDTFSKDMNPVPTESDAGQEPSGSHEEPPHTECSHSVGSHRESTASCEYESWTRAPTKTIESKAKLKIADSVVYRPPAFSTNPVSNSGKWSRALGGECAEFSPVVFEPECLNFSACFPNETQTKTLRLLNRTKSSVHFVILAPTDPAFHISFEKKGFLAPGMTQEIQVYFCPLEWRLYNSSLKVLCSSVNPAHHRKKAPNSGSADVDYCCSGVGLYAFPQLANIKLPRFLDFGHAPLGGSVHRTFELLNEHPVSFQFAIRTLIQNPDFNVAPTCGDVPAHGSLTIELTYTPTSVATTFFAFELRVADFGSKPIRVDAMGTCHGAPVASPLSSKNSKSSHDGSVDVSTGGFRRNRDIVLAQHPSGQKRSNCCEKPNHVVYNGVMVPNAEGHAVWNGVFTQQIGKKLGKFSRVQRGRADAASPTHEIQSTKVAQSPDSRSFFSGSDLSHTAGDTESDSRKARFEKRWKDAAQFHRRKHKTVMINTGEYPPNESRNQRLIARRQFDIEKVLRQCSLQDQIRDVCEFSTEPVVVSARWLPKQAHAPSTVMDESMNNSFALRRWCKYRFVLAVTSTIKKNRLLRRLATLKQAVSLQRSSSTSTSSTTDLARNGSVTKFSRDNRQRGEQADVSKGLVPPVLFRRSTTVQRLFQIPATTHAVPPWFFVKERTNVSDLIQCVKEYSDLKPIPQVDYQIMGLREHPIPPSAWRLEQSDQKLVAALLGSQDHPSPGGATARAGDGKSNVPILHFDPPVINDVFFIAPATAEFRPLVPLPRSVETDLGHCFQKVRDRWLTTAKEGRSH